ncbi:uncharacterized protein LOC119724970 [Patiria miniata]|uniref:Uncharacterized protein n=1 Tax=Patiria miniata TaxID=46514 RepID=A0A913ZMG1_PATMI|nr:uncharacterized protein LOC119724970 [Patiria miniata]
MVQLPKIYASGNTVTSLTKSNAYLTTNMKILVNKNNNNDEGSDTGNKARNAGETAGRTVDDKPASTRDCNERLAPTTAAMPSGRIVESGDESWRNPEQANPDLTGFIPLRLPPMNANPLGIFDRRRRAQEEILHELQREGIVADPRVAIGGVAYDIPRKHHRGRFSPFHHAIESVRGPLRKEREKMPLRHLDHRIKMCRAQKRRDHVELTKLVRLQDNENRLQQVREKMEYDEDLKIRQTSAHIMTKLAQGERNREIRERDLKWKREARRLYREQIRMIGKMKGGGMKRNQDHESPMEKEDDWEC